MRVGVEEAVDDDLLVDGLEQLARGFVTGRPSGAYAIGPPATSRITSSRDVEKSGCTPGTSRRENGATTSRHPPMFPPPDGSPARGAASPTGLNTASMSITC